MVLLLLVGAAALGGRKAYTSHKKHKAKKLALKNGTSPDSPISPTSPQSRPSISRDHSTVIYESQLQNSGINYHDQNDDEKLLSGDVLPPPAYVKDARDGEVRVVVPRREQAERGEQVGLPISYLESMAPQSGCEGLHVVSAEEAAVVASGDVRLRVVGVDDEEIEERGVWEEAALVLVESPVEMEEEVPAIPRRSSKRNSREVRGLSL